MTIFQNEPNSTYQSLSVYHETVTIKANEFPQPGDDYNMVHVQYGSTNLTLCLTRPLDIFCLPNGPEPRVFPFAEWTPREDEPLVTTYAWTPGIDEPTVEEWEPTDDYR